MTNDSSSMTALLRNKARRSAGGNVSYTGPGDLQKIGSRKTLSNAVAMSNKVLPVIHQEYTIFNKVLGGRVQPYQKGYDPNFVSSALQQTRNIGGRRIPKASLKFNY